MFKSESSYIQLLSNLVFVLIMLVACEPASSTILLGTTNNPSCWHEICPGRTTKQQALGILAQIPEVDSETAREIKINENRSYVIWNFTDDVVEATGEFHYQDDIVIRIVMDSAQPVTLERAIATFGEPEHVLITSGCADTRWLWRGLFWPNLGIKAASFDPHFYGSETSELQAEQVIEEFELFATERYDELLSRSEGVWTSLQPEVSAHLQEWRGYGEVVYWDVCR